MTTTPDETMPDYGAVYEMQSSTSLKGRVVACADSLGAPLGWGAQQFGKIVNDASFSTPWLAHANDDPRVYNPDRGLRPDVITDSTILARVNAFYTSWQATQAAAPSDGTPS